eukprot:1078698-Amphidinium_carterae.2
MNELRDEACPLLESHPLQEWHARGCLATRCRILDVAEQLGVLRLRRIGAEMECVPTSSWTSIKKAIGDKYVASPVVLRERFHNSYRKALAAKRVPVWHVSVSQRSHHDCIAPPRAVWSVCKFQLMAIHHGNCCFCIQWHTGTGEFIR